MALVFGGFSAYAPNAQAASPPAPGVLLESFDSGGAAWQTVIGTATPSTVTDGTEGAAALELSYNVAASLVEVGRVATPPDLPSVALAQLTMDVRGDGTWNTLYLKLRDATGEAFMYRVAAMGWQGWQPQTVDLTAPPAGRTGGNADGVLDAPVSLLTLLVARNGTQPATGTVAIDNLRSGTAAWTLPTSSKPRFVPSAGQGTLISFTATSPGDYRLELSDSAGRTKTFNGTASVAGPITLTWFGRADDYSFQRGNIRARLRHDTSPDGALSSTHATGGVPYLTGAALRVESGPGSISAVNSFLTTIVDQREGDRQAALMEDAFVRHAREPFHWQNVEPRKGYYDWARFDQAVATLRARNVDIIGTLLYTAPWATSAPAGTPASLVQYYPPASLSDYTRYATAVVHRYKDRVKVWQVWNEQNTVLYWKPGPDPVAYAAMLKAAYAAIKAEDPTATVISGGLASFDIPFMETMRAEGALTSMDGFGLHTYVNGPPEKGLSALWIDNAMAYLQRHVGGKPIWITEMGWSTCTTCETEAHQAEYLSRAYLEAAAKGVRMMTAYNLVEDGTTTTDWQDNLGLTEPGGRLKPAYTAWRDVSAALNQTGSAGSLAPTADGASTVVDDLATTSGLTVFNQGGGSATLTSTSARHGGTAGLQLNYWMTGAATAVNILGAIPLPGTPSAVSVWVYGDTSGTPVYLQFTDASGESYSGTAGRAAVRRWTRMTLYTDGSNLNWTHSGGDNNGVINYPITFRSITTLKGSLGQLTGTLYLDDLSVHYGTNVHGALLQGRGLIGQAMYRLGAAQTTQVPVTDSVASRQQGGVYTPVTVSGGLATTSLSDLPFYLTSAMGATPSSFALPGSVTIGWQSGDPAVQTLTVLDPSGAVVRTIVSQRRFDSGPHTATWDGLLAGGAPSPPGTYQIRLTLVGADGRTSTVDRPVIRS